MRNCKLNLWGRVLYRRAWLRQPRASIALLALFWGFRWSKRAVRSYHWTLASGRLRMGRNTPRRPLQMLRSKRSWSSGLNSATRRVQGRIELGESVGFDFQLGTTRKQRFSNFSHRTHRGSSGDLPRHCFQSLRAFRPMLLTMERPYPPKGIKLTLYVL